MSVNPYTHVLSESVRRSRRWSSLCFNALMIWYGKFSASRYWYRCSPKARLWPGILTILWKITCCFFFFLISFGIVPGQDMPLAKFEIKVENKYAGTKMNLGTVFGRSTKFLICEFFFCNFFFLLLVCFQKFQYFQNFQNFQFFFNFFSIFFFQLYFSIKYFSVYFSVYFFD